MAAQDPRKELYRLWFEFLTRAVASGLVIDTEYYRDWLPVEGLTFNKWWAGFHHKLDVPQVQLLEPGKAVPKGFLALAVPLDMNRAEALRQVKSALETVAVRGGRGIAQYRPTEGVNIKYPAFRLMLHCYDSDVSVDSKGRKSSRADRVVRVIEKYKKNEEKYGKTARKIDKLPKALDVDKAVGIGTDDVLRNYYRAVNKAKRIVVNVAKGEFPGKYT